MSLFNRLRNKDAVHITRRLLERKDREKFGLGVTGLNEDLYKVAKTIYNDLLLQVPDTDKSKFQELQYFIENIDLKEQFIVDYLKTALKNYNEKAERAMDKLWKDANDIMSQTGTQ